MNSFEIDWTKCAQDRIAIVNKVWQNIQIDIIKRLIAKKEFAQFSNWSKKCIFGVISNYIRDEVVIKLNYHLEMASSKI